MTPVLTYLDVPTFGASSARTQPPGTPYASGFLPGQVFPAEYENWFMNSLTSNGNVSETGLDSVVAEMLSILAAASISPDITQNSQVLTALSDLFVPLATFNELADATVINSGTSSSLTANSTPRVIINVNTGYTLTLPHASTCVGYVVDIVQGYKGQALLKITPFSGDSIAQLAVNVSCFLQNIDQGGNPYYFQHLQLVACESGNWQVVSGQFCPAPGSVDTGGTQYFLGNLIHLPLGNTTNRSSGNLTPPALDSWSSGIQITGLYGVPAGAKAVRMRVIANPYASSTGRSVFILCFGDNTSSTPTVLTAHPSVAVYQIGFTGQIVATYTEIDIPLDSNGKLYTYTSSASTVTVASSQYILTAVGYYMGD